MRKRGDRFRAYVVTAACTEGEIVYWTDSQKGMRDQCARLLEYKYRDSTIIVADTLDGGWSRRVNADNIAEWRI